MKYSDISMEKKKRFEYIWLNSKYLTEYLETFKIEDNFCVVMEYYKNRSLDRFIKYHLNENKNISHLV
jgi:serine/threonine protein kinase